MSSLLVIVVDTNPVWWGDDTSVGHGKISLSQCLDIVMVFANSHLMLSHENKLAVIAAHTNQSKFLFPKYEPPSSRVVPVNGDQVMDTDTPTTTETSSGDGKYELFGLVDDCLQSEMKQLVSDNSDVDMCSDSLVAGAVAMGLCYINRIERECVFGQTLSSRILVIKGSEDNPAQYMNFMNAVFTAQKQNVVMDACILDNDSGLLQQACDITGGIYLKIPQMAGLLQYLLWIFLPDQSMRSTLALPPKAQVDYRAACFCHRDLIDIGYVCSVCLSIFCSFSPICSTCQTTFKLTGPPKFSKKRSKKSTS